LTANRPCGTCILFRLLHLEEGICGMYMYLSKLPVQEVQM